MKRIGLTASEMSFENVHEDRHRFPEYTISSGELIKACVIKIGWGDDDYSLHFKESSLFGNLRCIAL